LLPDVVGGASRAGLARACVVSGSLDGLDLQGKQCTYPPASPRGTSSHSPKSLSQHQVTLPAPSHSPSTKSLSQHQVTLPAPCHGEEGTSRRASQTMQAPTGFSPSGLKFSSHSTLCQPDSSACMAHNATCRRLLPDLVTVPARWLGNVSLWIANNVTTRQLAPSDIESCYRLSARAGRRAARAMQHPIKLQTRVS
jgi:hypothetical protein